MNKDSINDSRMKELTDRATQTDDELLPLIMPETQTGHTTANEHKAAASDIDEEEQELDSKSARQVLMQALTDDEDERVSFSLPNVLRGDILTAKWMRRQIGWMVMIVAMAFFYVSNRYYAQQQQIKNNQLKEELKETHYDAMARSSQLMRNCRRSIIIDKLAESNSTLAMPDKQPAVVTE